MVIYIPSKTSAKAFMPAPWYVVMAEGQGYGARMNYAFKPLIKAAKKQKARFHGLPCRIK